MVEYAKRKQVVAFKSALRRQVNRAVRSFLPHPGRGLRCLLYHAITAEECRDPGQENTPIELFERQMVLLAEEGFRVISCAELVSRVRAGDPLPAKTVSISFDDGKASVREWALPVLRRHGFPATLFSMAEMQGGPYLTWEQAREMRAGGLVEFGCHGATHRRLSGLSEAERMRETLQAKERMEKALGFRVSLFAYPYGSYGTWDPPTLRALREAGFEGAFTSVFGLNTPRTDPYLLRRVRVSWFDSIPQFRSMLQGAGDWYAWVQRAQGAFGAA